MAYVGIDCATKLQADHVKGLKDEGITHVGRYLETNWKGLTADEVKLLSDAGIEIISVYETNPTHVEYFTRDQGKQDALRASQLAHDLKQANGSAIYFAVDYDAQGKDLGAILDYFSGVVDGIDSAFKIGAYGSYAVLNYLKQHSKVEYFFQTYAWSHGQVCDFAHLYQHENGVSLAGITVDRDKVLNHPGSWSLPKVVEHKTLTEAEVIKTAKYKIEKGDTFWELEAKNEWKHGVLSEMNPHVDAKSLQIGQIINVPEFIGGHFQNVEYHTVQKDENLSLIASKNGLSLAEIEKLNPQIKQPNLIHPGDKVRVK